MKKKLKRILSALLVAVMLVGIAPIGGIDLSVKSSAMDLSSYKVGDLIEFGSYPQSEVTDSNLISKIESAGANISWIDYNYYAGTGKSEDGNMKSVKDMMLYKDITYGGNKYRAVKINQYRPSKTGDTIPPKIKYQYLNGYHTGNTYYFKYEPLIWRVLDPSEGYVMCNQIIDSQAYQDYIYYNDGKYYNSMDCTNYASDWTTSSLRGWLNENFYNTSFTDNQKAQILTTHNENKCKGYYSTYNSADTYDKIFPITYFDARNSEYGYASGRRVYDTARKLYGTDYALCQGLDVETEPVGDGTSPWWLRTPDSDFRKATIVEHDGNEDSAPFVGLTKIGVVPALKFNPKSTIPEESSDTVINFSENKKVVPIDSEFNVSAKYKSTELIPSAETISCTIEGENGGLTVNGSLSILGTKDNAVISASFKAQKIGDYKIIFSSSDGTENSIDISIVSDTFDKYLASSLIKLRKDKIQKTQMLYGYIYDGGLSIGDNLEAFVRVKDYRKGIKYFYELVIMDLLLNSAKDDDFTDVLNSNAESIKDKLVSYGLKYNKYTSQTAFENAKISNLSESEKEKINKAFNDSKVMCDAFSDMNTLIDGFNTINDYIQALSKYAALQNVKKGYIDVLKAIRILEMNLHGSGAGVDLNVVEFVAALDDIIEKYENYQISVTDCFYDSASDLIWDLSREVAGEIVKYIVGAEAAAIITITRETVNLIWQVFEPKELFVAESTLKVTKYIENELKSVLDNVAAQFNSSGELEHAILFNNCYEMLLSCFTYGNSINSYAEDFRYEGTPAGIIGSLINSSKKVTHEEVCKRIEKSNEIVANEYSAIKNIAERYKSYIYDTNMIWEISLDYNVQLKRTDAPVLYDYSNTSITCTQCYYNEEPIDLTGKNPTRNGYEFSGWYYDKECTKKFVNMTKASGDLTLYAKWKPIAIYNVKDTKASINELNLNYMGSPFSTRSGSSETVANKDTYCIPAYIDGYEVASIEDNIQIKNKNAIGTLYIPNTVISVGKNAFENCENITKVIIPASVTTIANDAFNGCKNIKEVVYEGTKEQWDEINFGKNNDSIIDSKIKFNSSQDNIESNVNSVSVSDIKLNYKKSATIKPTIKADEGAKYTVKYSSSNTKVATVDENGKVYAAKKGSATITCTVTDSNGNTVYDTCKVTVKYSFGQWLIKILLFGWIWY